MKKTILLLVLTLLINLSFSQADPQYRKYMFNFNKHISNQSNHILKNFNASDSQTFVLVQKSPLFNLQDYQEKPNDLYGFYQAYKTIQQSDLFNRFPSLTTLKEQARQSHLNNIIPLAILIANYETIKKDAFNSTVTNDNEGFLIRNNLDENIFDQHFIFTSTTLRNKFKGLQTTFILKPENVFNWSLNSDINEIKIDFNDNLGFRKIKLDKNININYASAGKKELKFKILLKNGVIIKNTSTIHIVPSNNDIINSTNRTPTGFTSSIIPNLSAYGETTNYAGQGQYEIFLSTQPNAVFDKPLIIIDGFDPQDGRPIVGFTDGNTGDFIPGIYELLDFENNGNTQNLADLIRAEGFDVVILNFPQYVRTQDNAIIDGGSDFIERNAMLLVELIEIINSQKVGNQQNVIIGPSMGGLILRYALNYMEQNSLNHDTRLNIYFDTPHLGANVPIGFQHQFNYLAFGLDDFWFIGNQNVEALQPLINGFMKSNAARQMLIDSFEAHITNSDGVTFNPNLTLPQKHPFNEIFYTQLHGFTNNYPSNLRNVNMINGSGLGLPFNDINGNPILPARNVVDVAIDVESGVEAFLEDTFTPYINNQIEVSNVYIDFAWWVPAFDVQSIAQSRAQPYSHGVDASSGGLFNLGQIANNIGTNGIAGEFLNALQTDFFNFIPSVSSMDLIYANNQINWFQTNFSTQPFDAFYMPNQNEPHVTLTQANVDFAWNEIVLQDPANINDNTFNNGIGIANNPISSSLNLINNLNINNLEVFIFDITGKKVMTTKINNPIAIIQIPINLNDGIYFAKLITNDNKVFHYKIIIKNQ